MKHAPKQLWPYCVGSGLMQGVPESFQRGRDDQATASARSLRPDATVFRPVLVASPHSQRAASGAGGRGGGQAHSRPPQRPQAPLAAGPLEATPEVQAAAEARPRGRRYRHREQSSRHAHGRHSGRRVHGSGGPDQGLSQDRAAADAEEDESICVICCEHLEV